MITLPNTKQIPLDMVGSTAFGRYSKISTEQTFNMFVSDGWNVPYAGYEKKVTISEGGQGRGLYGSARYNHLISVVDDGVYTISRNLSKSKVATIATSTGDVFMDENNANQIAICDKSTIYIFDYRNNTFEEAITTGSSKLDFIPGHVRFHNGVFMAPSTDRSDWRLSDFNNGHLWPADSASVGEIQTKPDEAMAVVPFPGKGNLVLVFGKTVTEFWNFSNTQQLFPLVKNTFNNIDYGCLNQATIAENDNIVVWVGSNEKSGPVIMYSDGNTAHKISNDGINYRLEQLINPTNCYGFCFQQDGHQFYQVTWPDDDLSLAFDFTLQKFYTLCDTYMKPHIAKRVAFFNNSYYFISFVDGNLYELNSKYTNFDGAEIPRIRIPKNIRLPSADRFIVKNINFTIEQGCDANIQRVDFSMSKDGGESYSSIQSKELNPLGRRANKLNFWNMGAANDFVSQFRFWGKGRFLMTNGLVSIRQ